MFFNKLFQKRADRALPTQLAYEMIVAQARRPALYLAGGVEDSVDGRFDMLVLHVYLLINRMNADEDEKSKAFSQAVFDLLFEDMDHSLREMGVGDLSVGKKIKKMAQVFYGRAKAYDEGLKCYRDAPNELEDALKRNIYADLNESGEAAKMAAYMFACSEHLAEIDSATLLQGKLAFVDPETCF